ncbi:MAG TPA: hypothetical protein VFY40_23880 [Blastocatellia bacterium]|nr:hypothetical protein [Blastocatellia bacterium]
MKSLAYAIILLAFTDVTTFVLAQSTGVAPGKKAPEISGEVERAGAQIQVVLTNPSDKRAFEGTAKVKIGFSNDEDVQFPVALLPNQTHRFPVSLPNSSGNEYSLAVYNQTGNLVLFKIAPFSATTASVREPAPAQAPRKGAAELIVTAKLIQNSANKDAEIATPEQDEPPQLTFEIESETPIKDAIFILSARDFQRREQISIDNHASVEFKLPETLSERKLSYLITSATGQKLASGEVDLDQLTSLDSVSISAVTFDRPAYAPGESARAVVELLGDGQRGYRLEFMAKDGGGNVLLKDERRGSHSSGKSRQEFVIEIPREAHGPIVVDYRAFGGQTGAVFDSGSREITLKEAGENKTGVAKRLSP